MYSDQYLDTLETVYSDQSAIGEFEASPKDYLIAQGIRIPDAIEVLIHDPGEVGRPARVDFHWNDSGEASLPDLFIARQSVRELARQAYDILHSEEMKELKAAVRDSPEALSAFAADPLAYAATHDVIIPDQLELIVHSDSPGGPRIDVHFQPATIDAGAPSLRPVGHGCCYCDDVTCCNYWTGPLPD
jgi:hypothetical protein